jgi:NAD(P)-dependent dehydrogenase (short-subunit alcohol dehydrogenase family)
VSSGRFGGQVALVSGVARPPGIGRATALRLAAGGANVVCADLFDPSPRDTSTVRPELFGQIVAEVDAAGPGQALAVPQQRLAPEAAVQAALDKFSRLDVCCALNGVTGPDAGDGPLLDVADEAWQHGLDLNTTTAWRVVRAAARAMIDSGTAGAIVALSSYAAVKPEANVGAVGAARAAVRHLMAVFAQELGPHGIRCNAVAPLAVEPSDQFPNPGLLKLAESVAGSLSAWLARSVPLGRAQQADETAAVIEFLCSADASFVSGVEIPVSGGAC